MIYTIKAHPTKYKHTLFRSRLEARWAAFFDAIGWQWEYEPIDLPGWSPDFRVSFPCGHSECSDFHTLLVEVKPYFSVKDFEGHPCTKFYFGWGRIPADSSACFGANPRVTYWEMSHGAGGGAYKVDDIVGGWGYNISTDEAWAIAGNSTQWYKNLPIKP